MITVMEKDWTTLETIPEKIRFRRLELGFSQMDLAVQSGLSLGTIAKIEQGKKDTTMTVETLVRIARALQVTASDLLLGIR